MTEQSDAKRKSGGSRVVKAVVASIVLLIGGVIALVFIPVYFDREARGQATQGVSVGVAVSNRVLAYRLQQGYWPRDYRSFVAEGKKNAPAHIGDITVIKDGVVRIVFNAPDRLRGGSVEIETFQKEDKFFRACRGIGIKDGFLPAACRTHSDPYLVEPAK